MFLLSVQTLTRLFAAGSELLGTGEGRRLHHGVHEARTRLSARRSGGQEHDHEGGHRPGAAGATGRVARRAQRLRDQQILQAFVLQTAGERKETPDWWQPDGLFIFGSRNHLSLFAVTNQCLGRANRRNKEVAGSCWTTCSMEENVGLFNIK